MKTPRAKPGTRRGGASANSSANPPASPSADPPAKSRRRTAVAAAGGTPGVPRAAAGPQTAQSVTARLLILGGAVGNVPVLWRASELRKKLASDERPFLEESLELLQRRRQVVMMRHGKSLFVAFAGPLLAWLSATPAADAAEAVLASDEALFAAYRRLVRESRGFFDVRISALHRALGLANGTPGAAALGRRLADLWREGQATLSLGDWSLADDDSRASAVELDGERYLLIRLEESPDPGV